MSCFSAQSMLEKHGWTTGSGLGKDEGGIKQAIKVAVKNDTKGVGHDPGEEFTFHWWDHAFNSAANNINVNVDNTGVTVTKADEFKISAKKKQAKTMASKDMLYGRFIKAATLQGNDMVSETLDGSDDSEESDCDIATAAKYTDSELFKKCGGLTAHKGARHGLKLSGKLQRIMEQEAKLTPTGSRSGSPNPIENQETKIDIQICEKINKKLKKKKIKEQIDEASSKESSDSGILNDETPVKKKKKKSKRSKSDKEETCELSNPLNSCDIIEDLDAKSKSKKKKKKSKENKCEAQMQADTEIKLDSSLDKKKERKIVKDNSANSDNCDQGMGEDDSNGNEAKEVKRKSKKQKKKNKDRTVEHTECSGEKVSKIKRKVEALNNDDDVCEESSRKSKKKKKT